MANSDEFMKEFCRHYLKVGIGSLTKRDIDSLVMSLFDNYGYYEERDGNLVKGLPLGSFPNQTASERLRVPVSKIRTMRYEAGLKYGGSVAAVGLAGGAALPATVIPFLLRGVNLLGIDSVMQPYDNRLRAWTRVARDLPMDKLEAMVVPAGLEDLPRLGADILNGQVRGRVVVDVTA